MKKALVIIDMQNDFFEHRKLKDAKAEIVDNINQLTTSARSSQVPVIWIKQILKADLSDSPKHIKESGKGVVLENTQGCKLLSDLNVEDSDLEIIKTRYSGFFKTNFEKLLVELRVDCLIIAGINTHACVRMTAIDAFQRDFKVIIAGDCVASWDEDHHKITMKYFEPTIAKIMDNHNIIKLFENS